MPSVVLCSGQRPACASSPHSSLKQTPSVGGGYRPAASAAKRRPQRHSLPGRKRRRADSAAWPSKALQQVERSPVSTRNTAGLPELDGWTCTKEEQERWIRSMDVKTISRSLSAILRDMGVQYDPARLASALKGHQFDIAARAAQVAITLGSFGARVAKDAAMGQLEANMGTRAVQLRKLFSDLGPSFIKVGQALSSRPDLLPQTYLEALAGLQDRLPSFPTPIAQAVVEQELGARVSDVFSSLSAEPVAAASLGQVLTRAAQVFRGRLRSTGEEVAVKVQRPGIGEGIAVDMVLLRRLMTRVDQGLPQLSGLDLQPLTPLVDEFAARLFGELDYIAEGRNAERFAELYGKVPRIRVPRIYWEHTSRRVLTMEWIDGVKLTDKARMDAAGFDIIDFVDVGIECTLRQLLEHGYFHADPHPGNLLATPEGDLAYLDFGMMSDAPERARFALISHIVHLVNRDYEAMCRDYYALDFMDPSIDTAPIAPSLAVFFNDVLDQSVSQLNFKSIVDGLGNVLFQYPFRVPSYYALILRSLTVLEGLALRANRNYKLLGKAYPYVARRLLTDPSPQLRASLEELVLDDDGSLRVGRIENLVRQSNKSANYGASQLWLLAEWVLSDKGRAVRLPLAREFVRLLDVAVADDVRRRVREATGNAQLAARLVPRLPGEIPSAQRARLLISALTRIISGPDNTEAEDRAPQASLQQLQESWRSVQKAVPRLQQLMALPGAVEVQQEVTRTLSQKATARALKLLLGPATS